VVAGFDLSTPAARWELPRILNEVSGLAAAGPGVVLAHGDEDGTIVEFDYRRGKRLRILTLGRPVVTGDFEGIEIVGRRVSLMTSDGRVFSGDVPASATVIEPVSVGDTGLGRFCELEGLAADGDGGFLLPCKTPRTREPVAQLSLWRWSPSGGAAQAPLRLAVPGGAPGGRMHPSAIARSASGSLVLLFGQERAIGEFSPSGAPISVWGFDARRHPQPEGLAITADGWLLVADEADGPAKRGTITVYGHAK
jgi:hypothetical protein